MPGYQAALEGAAYRIYEHSSCLEVGGADQVAFLQRQTSNDLRLLEPGRVVLSVLTSPTAQILDIFILQACLTSSRLIPKAPRRCTCSACRGAASKAFDS